MRDTIESVQHLEHITEPLISLINIYCCSFLRCGDQSGGLAIHRVCSLSSELY